MAEHQKPIRLAQQALRAALAGKREATTRYVVRIDEECGGEGITLALMAWCDTFLDHATDGHEPTGQVNIGLVQQETGAFGRVGDQSVPPEIQWAGRMVLARSKFDQQAWATLIDELPTDGLEIGKYVGALLTCVALTINGLPRGFARMGRGS